MVVVSKAIKKPIEIEMELETIGRKKSELSFSSMFVLAILAGAYIGFGGALATLVSHDLSQYVGVGLSKLVAGIVFSIGLILILLGGAELFTGNNLLVVPVFSHRIKISKVLRNWTIVYVGNFLGSILLVVLVYFSGYWRINASKVGIAAVEIATAKVNLSFIEAFVRGILANWLVCLAVWLSLAAKEFIGKIFGIIFPIMAFVAMGFEHSIANMYFIPLGLFLKNSNPFMAGIDVSNLTWSSFFIGNLLPVTLGNIIGGSFFVGFLYWFIYRRKGKKREKALEEEQKQAILEYIKTIESEEKEIIFEPEVELESEEELDLKHTIEVRHND